LRLGHGIDSQRIRLHQAVAKNLKSTDQKDVRTGGCPEKLTQIRDADPLHPREIQFAVGIGRIGRAFTQAEISGFHPNLLPHAARRPRQAGVIAPTFSLRMIASEVA
jgi:hypothetical protein